VAVGACDGPSFDPELVSFETDCANALDDDLDGLADGLDPDCWDETAVALRPCPSVPGTADATAEMPRRLSADPMAWDGDLPSVATAEGFPEGAFLVDDPETALVAVSDEAFRGGLARTRLQARIVSTAPRVCIGVVPAERALPNPQVLLGDGIATCFTPGNADDSPPDLQLLGVRTEPVDAERGAPALPPGLPVHVDLDIEAPNARVRLAARDEPSRTYLHEILPPMLGPTDPVRVFVLVEPGTGSVDVAELGFFRGRGDTCPRVASPGLFDADAEGGTELRGLALARHPSGADPVDARDPGPGGLTACALVATGPEGRGVGVWRADDGGRHFVRGPDLLPDASGPIRGADLTRGVCGGFVGLAVVDTEDGGLRTVRFQSDDCRTFTADPPRAAPDGLADPTHLLGHLSVLPAADIDGGDCVDRLELAVPFPDSETGYPAFRRFLDDGDGRLEPAGSLTLRPRDIALASECPSVAGPVEGPPVFSSPVFQVTRVGANLVFFGPDGGASGEWAWWREDQRGELGCPLDAFDEDVLLVSPATAIRLRPSRLSGASDETEIGTARFALDPVTFGASRYGLVLYSGAPNVGCRDCGRAVGPAFLQLGTPRGC